MDFAPDDYYDILVCQMAVVGSEDLTDDHASFMDNNGYPSLRD
jgi:hypothetical protein